LAVEFAEGQVEQAGWVERGVEVGMVDPAAQKKLFVAPGVQIERVALFE
jgi:hypothetical protein